MESKAGHCEKQLVVGVPNPPKVVKPGDPLAYKPPVVPYRFEGVDGVGAMEVRPVIPNLRRYDEVGVGLG